MTRQPYVEDASVANAYRRSAQIDREEADCLDRSDPRYERCLASAAEFEGLAEYHERLVTELQVALTLPFTRFADPGYSQDTGPAPSG